MKKESVKDVVMANFIDGKIQQGEDEVVLTKENLIDLPGEVFVEAFKIMNGVIDPKAEGQLTTPSTTAAQPQEN